MPLLDFEVRDYAAENLASLRLNVQAVMLWPDDEGRRKSILLSATQDGLEALAASRGVQFTVSAEFLRQRGPRVDPRQAILDATENAVAPAAGARGISLVGGTLAGEILLQGFALQEAGNVNVSLGQCLDEVSRALTGKERSKRARPQDIRAYWHRYRNVAHFWAADLRLGRQGLLGGDLRLFGGFLLLAELLGNRGSCLKHRNAQEALLDPAEIWRISPSLGSAIILENPSLRLEP